MRNRLFPLAAGVSAVICVAVCVFWPISNRQANWLYYQGSGSGGRRVAYGALTYMGDVQLERFTDSDLFRWSTLQSNAWSSLQTNAYGPLRWGHVGIPAGDDGLWIDTLRFPQGALGRRGNVIGPSPRVGEEHYRYRGHYHGKGWSPDGVSHYVLLPLWLVAAATAIPPLAWVITVGQTVRRFRKTAPGACKSCGYDLRATPDRCHEYGAVPAKGAAA